MTWTNSMVVPQMAVERGWQTWNVFITNWGLGTGTTGNDTNSLLFPNPSTQVTIPSIAGVAIGPQSQVDRCFIGYTPNIDATSLSAAAGTYNITTQVLLSVESPITYPLSAPISVNFDGKIVTRPSFIPNNGTGVPITFNSGASTVAVAPLLHLIFYLQNVAIVPTRRYPFVDIIDTGAVAAGSEVIQKIIPIYGRKQATLTVTNTSANNISIRVGLIAPPGATGGTMYERTLTTLAGIASNVTTSVTFGREITDSTYMTIYMTGAGPADGSAYGTVEFTDIPGG